MNGENWTFSSVPVQYSINKIQQYGLKLILYRHINNVYHISTFLYITKRNEYWFNGTVKK